MIPKIRMHRFEWSIRNSDGFILDLGCNDTSPWAYSTWYPSYPDARVIKNIIFFDIDLWVPTWLPDPICVRGDGLNLPFKTNTFDSVVIGDVTEHVNNPFKLLSEAKRVCRNKIIITIPVEDEWCITNENKLHNNLDANDNIIKTFLAPNESNKNEELRTTLQHPSKMGRCIAAVKETKLKHLWHIQHFNDEIIIQLLDSLNMKYNIFKLCYGIKDQEIVTYGIVAYK